ncbi:MAG TPA: riboflavin synthase [Lacipirellula sp.]
MFTGLVQSLATITHVSPDGPGVRLAVRDKQIAAKSQIGDSIAINGCCLTVVAIDGADVAFEAGPETLQRTNLGRLTPGDHVNLESSLRMGDNLGGHLVTGHIDAVGRLERRDDDGQWCTMWFAVPHELTRQMASKGSVAVDGVSLTLVDVEANRFSAALIPHTLTATTLGALKQGDEVNIETDLLAKYVERQLALKK